MTRWKLTIEYKGTAYAGWQRQDGVPSVQQTIEEALLGFCQQDIRLHVAGRTDAGVHARGQVAHFDLEYGDRPLDAETIVRALNAHLRDADICILSAEQAAPEFHARFGATSKLYTYDILNRQALPAIEKDLVWHVRRELDVSLMRDAAQHLLGQHDFSTFRAGQCQAKSPIRTLDRLDIVETPLAHGRRISFHAEARSFLHHQVRNMVGALALVGERKWTPDDLKTALEAKNRTKGPATAPPDGLYLVEVRY